MKRRCRKVGNLDLRRRAPSIICAFDDVCRRILNKDPSTALRSAQDDSVCHSEGAKSPKNLNRNDVIGKADRVHSKFFKLQVKTGGKNE